MTINRWRRGLLAAVMLASLSIWSAPALAAPTSSAEWTWTHGPITCKFAGIHSASGGTPYARTNDTNGGCANLRVRLKYKNANGVTLITSWLETTGNSITVWAAQSGTAVASQHEALNGWQGLWSGVKQPHAW